MEKRCLYSGDIVMPRAVFVIKIYGKLCIALYRCGGCGKNLPWRFWHKHEIRCGKCLDYNVVAE